MSKIDRFAEYLAQEMSIAEAGEAVGWNKHNAVEAFRKIRRKLGWQAA